MGQNEIFKLLLIILLLISNHDDCDNNNHCHGLTGNLNQIIIVLLLFGFIPTNDTDSTDTDTTF